MTALETIIIETDKHPTYSIIWLHGLGADGHDFVPIASQLNIPKSIAVRFIFPHAPVMPVTLNNGMAMRSWFDIYRLDLNAKFDLPGVNKASNLIQQLLNAEHEKGIAYENMVLAGFSQGGAMALYTGLTFSEKLAGILALSTFLPMVGDLSAQLSSVNKQTPIMMAHGAQDLIVNCMFGKLSSEFLVKSGFNVTWHEYETGHNVCAEEIADISGWLKHNIFKLG